MDIGKQIKTLRLAKGVTQYLEIWQTYCCIYNQRNIDAANP